MENKNEKRKNNHSQHQSSKISKSEFSETILENSSKRKMTDNTKVEVMLTQEQKLFVYETLYKEDRANDIPANADNNWFINMFTSIIDDFKNNNSSFKRLSPCLEKLESDENVLKHRQLILIQVLDKLKQHEKDSSNFSPPMCLTNITLNKYSSMEEKGKSLFIAFLHAAVNPMIPLSFLGSKKIMNELFNLSFNKNNKNDGYYFKYLEFLSSVSKPAECLESFVNFYSFYQTIVQSHGKPHPEDELDLSGLFMKVVKSAPGNALIQTPEIAGKYKFICQEALKNVPLNDEELENMKFLNNNDDSQAQDYVVSPKKIRTILSDTSKNSSSSPPAAVINDNKEKLSNSMLTGTIYCKTDYTACSFILKQYI